MKVNWIAECEKAGIDSSCMTEWSSAESASFNFANMLFYSVVQDDRGWLLCKGELASIGSSSCVMMRFSSLQRVLSQMASEVSQAVESLSHCVSVHE